MLRLPCVSPTEHIIVLRQKYVRTYVSFFSIRLSVFKDKTTSAEPSRKFHVEASYALLKMNGLLRHGFRVGDFMSMGEQWGSLWADRLWFLCLNPARAFKRGVQFK